MIEIAAVSIEFSLTISSGGVEILEVEEAAKEYCRKYIPEGCDVKVCHQDHFAAAGDSVGTNIILRMYEEK